MATPILTANLDTLITGIMPGVNEEHVPFWIKAHDVVMEAAGIRPSPGYVRPYVDNGFFDDQSGNFDDKAGLFDSAGTRVYLDTIGTSALKGVHVQKQSDGRLLVVWGDATSLYTFNGLTVHNATRTGTPYSGNESPSDIVDETHWSFAQWGDWVLATNGSDIPQVLKYPANDEFIDLPNFPGDTAQIVRVLGPHALFFNLSGTHDTLGTPLTMNDLVFCAQDNVEQWDPLTYATAGVLPLKEFSGPIIAVEHLGGRLIGYGETGAHLIEYGGQFLFGGTKGALGLRALSKNSIASIGSRHIVLTQSGIFASDGYSFQPLAYPALGAWLESVVDWSQKSRIVHQVDVRRTQVKWTLPGIDNDFVLVYNWQTDKITTESRPFSAGSRVESLWYPLAGYINGGLQMLLDAPNDRAPELITKPLMIAGRTGHSFLDALVMRWSGANATIYVKYAENQDELDARPWELLGSVTQKENILWMMREAMFVQFRLISTGQKWLLSGMEALGKPGGGRL